MKQAEVVVVDLTSLESLPKEVWLYALDVREELRGLFADLGRAMLDQLGETEIDEEAFLVWLFEQEAGEC